LIGTNEFDLFMELWFIARFKLGSINNQWSNASYALYTQCGHGLCKCWTYSAWC